MTRVRIYSLFLAFSFLTALLFESNAQVTKYPLLELFTNTRCSICGAQDPGFVNRLEDYEGQYHHVSIYPGFPYTSCKFYQDNTTENRARADFYPQVFGTPEVAINGVEFRSPNAVSTTVLDDLTDDTSWLSVVVSETSGATRDVVITLDDHVGGSLGEGLLYAVIVEREIMYNAPNGINLHHNVFRQFLTSIDGDAIDLSSGSTVETYQYTLDGEWQAGEVYVVAWVTGTDSKAVFNSGTRFDPLTSSTRNAVATLPLSIYPNPAAESVNIEVPQNAEGALRIFNLDGRLIREIAVNGAEKMTITDLPDGSYFAEVMLTDARLVGQFRIVR